MFLMTNMSFARKPAVEPVTGISIDQYDDVAPEKATPYNFNQKKTKALTPVKTKKEVKQKTLNQMQEKTTSTTNQVLVLLMVMVLPIAVWLGLMKGVKDLDHEAPNNVVDLNSKKPSNDDDDMNFPKAS
ncbi:hypothetical protein [Halobacteriovorax sp. HLS]|uniref:hypothetical protein n=1 Tax=Halobacteriovorax sp. HLS TaxID=2234000 RepID=UPI000FD7E3F0|nr:hypothetical protein [Halobacteriovorax sp. HLS]